MTDYSPIARIVLRYLVGVMFMGSPEIGEQLATDPDVIMFASLAIGAAIEAWYGYAKRKGGAT